MRILEAADNSGITFIDTADVYNGGQSESAIGDYISTHPDRFYITTKCGRRLNPHIDESYTPQAIRGFVEDSIGRLKSEQLKENIRAAELPELTAEQMQKVKQLYDSKLRDIIHPQW